MSSPGSRLRGGGCIRELRPYWDKKLPHSHMVCSNEKSISTKNMVFISLKEISVSCTIQECYNVITPYRISLYYLGA